MLKIVVLVDGKQIPHTLAMARIRVMHAAGELSSAEFEMTGSPADAGAVPDADGTVFVPGARVEILLGYQAPVERVFAGIIVARRTSLSSGGGTLAVRCAHPLYRSALATRSRTWVDSRDTDCIATLCEEHGVQARVVSGGAVHGTLVQSGQTDWDFMRARAGASGLLLVADSEGLQVGPPELAAAPALALQIGVSVMELALESDLRQQPAGVEVSAWDFAQQECLRVVADEPALPAAPQLRGVGLAAIHGQIRHINASACSEQAMQVFASGQLLGARLAARTGHLRTVGVANLCPGQWVHLEGAGAMLDGELFVTRVEHRVQQGEWLSEIGVGNPFPVQHDPLASMTDVTMQSLQPGVVHGLESDPDGEDRIQVILPLLGDRATPVLARLLSFDAGNNRGASFVPEIGDEVLVGFAGDASQPIVLGSLHSSAHPGPLPLSDENHQKGYFSRSGLQLRFDDELRAIALSTPAGNLLALSDDGGEIRVQDSHGNRITMDAAGIRIESAADLVLQATKQTRLDSHDVRMKASAQLEVEGKAGAELKSAATVKIRGGMVQIN